MDAKEIIQRLSIEDIIQILESLDADILYDKETYEYILSSSICHHSESHKLYLYKSSKSFYCYSNCHSMSLFDVIMKSKCITFKESLDYIYNILHSKHRPRKLIKKYKSTPLNDIVVEPLPQVKKKFLYELYKDVKITEWEKDNINYKATKKFKIRKDDVKNRIIIPHFNVNNELIGIRVRHLNPIDIQTKGKYIPLFYDGIGYNFPISQNLYGLNISKDNIKKYKKALVGESEKFSNQYETYYPDNNLAISLCGSNFSGTQKKILIDLGVEEIILCLDRQYKKEDSEEAEIWRNKIYKMTEDLLPYCRVSYTWDTDENQLLKYKDAPTDRGKKVFETLIQNRIFIN